MVARLVERLLVRRALPPLALLLGVALAGVAGYVTLADVGPVEAVFWLVDPTSVELYVLDHPAAPATLLRGYAVLVVLSLVLSSVWLGETVLTTAFGDRIREELRRVQNERRIADLEGHAVVCGYGMFGATVTDRLLDDGRDVVVVETETAELEGVPEAAFPVEGDARQQSVLERAGVGSAGTVVAAIDDSNANIQTAIVATELAPGSARLVVRVGEAMYEDLARRAGADEVVIPEVVSAEGLSERL